MRKKTGIVSESEKFVEKLEHCMAGAEEPACKKKKSRKKEKGMDGPVSGLDRNALEDCPTSVDNDRARRKEGVQKKSRMSPAKHVLNDDIEISIIAQSEDPTPMREGVYDDARMITEEASVKKKTIHYSKNGEGGPDLHNGWNKRSELEGKKHQKKPGKRELDESFRNLAKKAKTQVDSITISKVLENPIGSKGSTFEEQNPKANTHAINAKEKMTHSNGIYKKTQLTQKGSEFCSTKIQKEEIASSVNTKELENCVVAVSVECQDVHFKPLKSFEEAELPENVLSCCRKFDRPSAIQAHAWPFLLEGRDFVGISATGSGKTLAFGVPALMHVLKRKKPFQKHFPPLVLVLSPTRELAQQIADVLEEAGSSCGVKTACLYGGASKGSQRKALKSSVAMIVATPGRLQDLVDEGSCSLKDISFLVLDEADRMLDLGFEPAIRAIVSQISKKRQTVMFSATWPIAVDQLAREFQESNPVKVTVGSQELAANHDVTQIVEVLDDRARDMRLESLLRVYHKSRMNRILVFVLYKKEAVRVESFLWERGWKVTAVHGDKGQGDRTKAVTAFKDGTFPLLVATDVAARGLDIPDVEYVINYSFPLTIEDYVHRVGRTGRAGRKGIAHTFFTHVDKARSGELANVLREAGQVVPDELLKFGTHVKKKESKIYGAHFREVGADAPKSTKITFSDADD